MITVVSGKIGSGKSHDVTRIIRDHVRRGGAVRTNMTLDISALERSIGRRVYRWQVGKVTSDTDPAQIPRGDLRGRGTRRTLVVLDEALNWFDSESSKDKGLKASWGIWLRQSDKLGQDVYFIAQNFERSAKWIRELAQVNREIIPVRTIRILGFIPIGYLVPFGSSMYIVQSFDVRSLTRLSSEIHFYSSSIWSCYDTSETYGFRAASSAYDVVQLPQFQVPSFWILSLFVSTLGVFACLYKLF